MIRTGGGAAAHTNAAAGEGVTSSPAPAPVASGPGAGDGLPEAYGDYQLIFPWNVDRGLQSEFGEMLETAKSCIQSVTLTSTASTRAAEEAVKRQQEENSAKQAKPWFGR